MIVTDKPFYYLDFEISDFFYGRGHPMKPIRIKILNELIFSYGLNFYLSMRSSVKMPKKIIWNFHDNFYYNSMNFQFDKSPWEQDNNPRNLPGDCPVIEGILKYTKIYSGGTFACSQTESKKGPCMGINWSGGYHHGKKSYASGFCYANDIVLLMLELNKKFKKILYIDIDAHHGDGVEEAYYLIENIFPISFHKYCSNFFPGTGRLFNKGLEKGRGRSMNVPLFRINQKNNFFNLFHFTLTETLGKFDPEIIVFQGGADSLKGDKVGNMNVSMTSHNRCLKSILKTNKKFIILGGGGYNLMNVAKCWLYETASILNRKIQNSIPYNRYLKFFEVPDIISEENYLLRKKKAHKYLSKLDKFIKSHL